jgi:hypothetical protein
MTPPPVLIGNWDSGMEARWREWQARAVQGDRQRTLIVTRVGVLLALSFLVWTVALILS